MKFEPFQKIARLKRECFITEKIDGTNAQITIIPIPEDQTDYDPTKVLDSWPNPLRPEQTLVMLAGSRTRWITPVGKDDNFGFAAWVFEHREELRGLGLGQHFGEWWGKGIQRGYGQDVKRFSLFNVFRWKPENPTRPACCEVVPTLHIGRFESSTVDQIIRALQMQGSQAAPGFMKPEGVVVFLTAARTYFKVTVENDEEPKEAMARRLAHEAKVADAVPA